MANMSYCRFENTLRDLRDCYDNMDNDNLSKSEFYARKQMIEMCINIANQHDDIVEQEFLEDDFEDEPEYDSAGFTEDDRIVDGQYRVIDNDK